MTLHGTRVVIRAGYADDGDLRDVADGSRMTDESLAEAFVRLGLRPLPPVEELAAMSDEERRAAIVASSVSAEQYEQLPDWYREKMRQRPEATIARRHAEQAAARRVS